MSTNSPPSSSHHLGTTPLPRWTWIPATAALAFLTVPLIGIALRLPWPAVPHLLTSDESIDALRVSLLACLTATGLCLLLGLPAALVLARAHGRWVAPARVLISLPMVLPPVVAGLALLTTLGRRGILGTTLTAFGIDIAFTTIAVIVAQTFVAMPFLITSVEGALRAAGHAHEDVAATLGASPTTVLFRVTIPRMTPAIASGTALAFARCLGEFGATLTFAGSLQGVTRTLPLQIYLQRESDTDTALALALVVIVIAVLVVGAAGALTRHHTRRQPT
ncbi:hypothetical protein KEM60_02905 [Austwickia sp. TVS 96-490-7B]|uniref:ABC transporter permease n=1 Tax=Austwickia sp. TVS 96-490-7B TaxID=2830843 RepID=UPI001C55DA19|nr:ABC transporter permease [Austwickia sp. TVS 96-490-7B]MBW3086676.1 hypothetical protein [Austwickia sp. TVS 96-490-7B]